jgi:PKD repeat protein
VLPTGAPNLPPTASLIATPASGTAPLSVSLNASGSQDPDGQIASYSWVFGDGSTAAGTASIISHTYTSPGSYTARVTATDNRGATSSATASITAIGDQNLIAAPSNLAGSSNKGAVKLTWGDNSNNEEGFRIERAPSGSSAFAVVGTAASNVTSYSESVARGNYNYRVQAFNLTTGKVSAYSNVVAVRSK